MDRRKLRANNWAAYFHLEKKQEKIIYYVHKSIKRLIFSIFFMYKYFISFK